MSDQPVTEEYLSKEECWERLRQAPVGRLGVWVEDHPEIFPVTFTVERQTLLFRCAPGAKLDAILSGTPVAFETDGLDASTSVAWSVLVKGGSEQVTRSVELMDTAALPLTPWHPGEKGVLVRIIPTEITGRRFPIADPDWWRSLTMPGRPGDHDVD